MDAGLPLWATGAGLQGFVAINYSESRKRDRLALPPPPTPSYEAAVWPVGDM